MPQRFAWCNNATLPAQGGGRARCNNATLPVKELLTGQHIPCKFYKFPLLRVNVMGFSIIIVIILGIYTHSRQMHTMYM